MSLTTAELTAMRDASNSFLPDTCTISRVTRTKTAAGSYSEAWANLATDVACRLDSLSEAAEAQIAGASGTVAEFALAVAWNQDITEKDRVVLNTNTYEVVAVKSSQSWLVHRRCLVKRVQS